MDSLSDTLRKQLKTPDGTSGVVVLNASGNSGADTTGLKAGDVISKINDTAVASAADFYRLINGPDKEYQLRILRGKNEFIIILKK